MSQNNADDPGIDRILSHRLLASKDKVNDEVFVGKLIAKMEDSSELELLAFTGDVKKYVEDDLKWFIGFLKQYIKTNK